MNVQSNFNWYMLEIPLLSTSKLKGISNGELRLQYYSAVIQYCF